MLNWNGLFIKQLSNMFGVNFAKLQTNFSSVEFWLRNDNYLIFHQKEFKILDTEYQTVFNAENTTLTC